MSFLHFDLIEIIKASGYLGVFAIVFAESGILLGLFLPGDSLLFTAGFLASQGYLDIWVLALGAFVAAVVGNEVGYAIGRKMGPAVFAKEESLFFSRRHVDRTHAFFAKHGGRSIVLARFMPIVRTIVTVMAGVGKMDHAEYTKYNLVGALLWAMGVSLLGYFLGATIPNVDRYLLPIIGVIILASVAPSATHILRDPAMRQRIARYFRRK